MKRAVVFFAEGFETGDLQLFELHAGCSPGIGRTAETGWPRRIGPRGQPQAQFLGVSRVVGDAPEFKLGIS